MAKLDHEQAVQLARTLRKLRESHWPDVDLTQAQLANALSKEQKVAPATLSSWESTTNPKTPTSARLTAYARFFATRSSLEGDAPHLVAVSKFTPEELDRYHELDDMLQGLIQVRAEEAVPPHSTFTFDDGPVTVICPLAPQDERGPLAREGDPNFAKLQQYADLDALIEIYGHLRATNPQLDVYHRLGTEVAADDLSTHVVLLGGIAWNRVTRSVQEATQRVPIEQVKDPSMKTGDPFQVKDGEFEKMFHPRWDEAVEIGGRELVEDVAYLARLPNPFNTSRTLTICNGIHSRGVLGAVRCLTDKRVRDANERYLAQRFQGDSFAMLLRVGVVANETMSPYLQNPHARLYEWSPANDGGSE